MPIKKWDQFLTEGELRAAAIVVCLNEHAQFLIIRRSNIDNRCGQWTIPGGHVDDEDCTIEDAAVRELHEETDLLCKISDLLYLGEPKPEKFYYMAKNWEGTVNILKPNPVTSKIEHDDYRWASINDIKDIDNSEIPIYLLEKALEMSNNE